MTSLIDSLLTFIERREAEQIQYGLYDVLLTGDEVLNTFALAQGADVCTALDELHRRGLIMRFENNTNHRDWRFRSRTGETVRLVSKLRQRVSASDHARLTARADRSPRLVHDLKFESRPRQVPVRNLSMPDLTAPLKPNQAQAADILEALFPSPNFKFSGFQQRALHAIADYILIKPQRGDVRGVVVTASTGAGKTYAFFLPVLAYCIAKKGGNGQTGVKAICIYPRVALSENQLEDFVNLIYQANQHLPSEHAITVGIDSGASPYSTNDFTRPNYEHLQKTRGWRWDAIGDRYICPFARCPIPDCGGELAVQRTQPERIFCTRCDQSHSFILYAKDQFRIAPPDVLIATTESLNSRLMDSSYQMLFGNAVFPPPAVVMLDEIHLQSSTKGTQIAFLLRRLAARIRRGADEHTPPSNLVLVGLSATIAQPKTFFADLTGLTVSAITEVKPDEETEMITAGAEQYLFIRAEQEEDTAVISTLLQTAMLVVHTLPLPSPQEQAEGIAKYKTFGFAQSLDTVGRWYYQLSDAEKMNQDNIAARAGRLPQHWPIEHTPLYWYRVPEHNRRLFPDFFGRGRGAPPCQCPQQGYPDPNCVYFQEGECWWLLRQGQHDPMRIKRKTASDRQTQIEPEDDLVITTTALEVGYDDASLMGVIQYQSPSNIASFVQRKGRGGRKVGTRPLITTVLSPYKTGDVFLYQNHHLLVEPRFKKLPLNPSNPFLQRIHGFYALFDWLAYLAGRQGLQLALSDRMSSQDYDTLQRLVQASVLDAFRDYLADAFDLRSDPAHLQALLVDPGARRFNDNGILSYGVDKLMQAMHESLDNNCNNTQVEARSEVLRDYLPQNLFSDINLPELDVQYGQVHQAEDIALGLAETMPGNVTFRGRGGSCWIAPPLGAGRVFILEDAFTLSNERRHDIAIEISSMPARIEQLMYGLGCLPRDFSLIRPVAVRLERFGTRDGSQWWFDGNVSPGNLIHIASGQATPCGQNIRQMRHASSAYPVGFTQIEPPPNVGRRFSFDARSGNPLFDDLGRALFSRIDFASDADNGRLIKVRRVLVGSQYSLKLAGEDDPVEGVTTFARRDTPTELAAIGYEMQTEGITFILTDLLADLETERLPISEETSARLRRNFVKHAAVTTLAAQADVNYFAAERFAEVMLTVADLLIHNRNWTLENMVAACRSGSEGIRRSFNGIVGRVYHLSRKNTTAVMDLFNQPDIRGVFADRYQEIYAGGTLYRRYLEDTFVHTLKHALKQTAQGLAGVEATQYVSAYTQLNMDFDELCDRPIWLYELGVGGVGVLRSVQEELRQNPARFWRILETKLEVCETEAEDRFLLDVLSHPEATLDTLHALVTQVCAATSSGERQMALHNLRDGLRQMCRLWPTRSQIRLLIKLFSDDYTGGGIGLRNWKLYCELNALWIPSLTARLGRLPTLTEARGLLHYALTKDDTQRRMEERTGYPELTRLLELYQHEYNGDDVRRVFENAVGRRLLLNCRDACPTCLDEGPSCQIDSPGLSLLTLSRALVGEVLQTIRRARTIACAADTHAAELSQRIELLFHQDITSPIIITAPADRPELVAALLSHLTDYGIVDRLERRYPRLAQARVVGNELHAWLVLERET